MILTNAENLVLALRPFTRGLAFASFKGPLSPIDWGIKEIRGGKRNARCLAAVRKLMQQFAPAVLVLPDGSARSGERSARLLGLIANHAKAESIEIHRYGRNQVLRAFAAVGATTRYEIAQAIASQVPAFGHQLPPLRKTWDREDPRLCLFDAAALAMTHYAAPPREESEPDSEPNDENLD